MGKIHRLTVVPGNEGERYFMKLLNQVEVKPENVLCKRGEIFNTQYNEYILSDGLFNLIRDHLREKKGLSLVG